MKQLQENGLEIGLMTNIINSIHIIYS